MDWNIYIFLPYLHLWPFIPTRNSIAVRRRTFIGPLATSIIEVGFCFTSYCKCVQNMFFFTKRKQTNTTLVGFVWGCFSPFKQTSTLLKTWHLKEIWCPCGIWNLLIMVKCRQLIIPQKLMKDYPWGLESSASSENYSYSFSVGCFLKLVH